MGIEMSQFEHFTASSPDCDKCKATMPVRERLLLVLPAKELYDYLCTGCAASGGSREVTTAEYKLELPVLQPPRIKARDSVDTIRALKPDLIVVMAYGQILPREVLEIPTIACLNLHASLLPRWRGAAPIQAAIAAGDRETGITVMYMDEGLYTGDILLQRKIEIAPDETGASLHDKLAQIAQESLAE